MKNIIKTISVFMVASLFLYTACEKNEPIFYDGAELVHLPVLSRTVAFTIEDDDPVFTGRVHRISNNADAALSYEIKVLADISSATEGTHFDVVDKNPVINTGEFIGEFVVNFYSDAFDVGDTRSLYIAIDSEGGTTSNDTMRINVVKTSTFSLYNFEGLYDVIDTDEDGDVYEYQIELAVHDEAENEMSVTGLWEVDLTVIMNLDEKEQTLIIPIQEYGCYNAGTDYDPLCTILTALRDRTSPVTGEFVLDGSELSLTSGYFVAITTVPYDTYAFTPFIASSVWTKSDSKKLIYHNRESDAIQKRILHVP